MELKTIVEKSNTLTLPSFQHSLEVVAPLTFCHPPQKPTLSIHQPNQQFQYGQRGFPHQLINQETTTQINSAITYQSNINHEQSPIQCYLLFGIAFQVKDWQEYSEKNKEKEEIVAIETYQGKKKSKVVFGRTNCYESMRQPLDPADMFKIGKQEDYESYAKLHCVKIKCKQNGMEKFVYYIPFCGQEAEEHQRIKIAYFNNKMLQTLNGYVSLENKSTSYYKDLAHHQFQNLLYGGRVNSCVIYVRINNADPVTLDFSVDFLSKLSGISMADKHLLEEIDPTNLSQLKKQIRKLCLEENRLRNCLTLQKKQLIEEIQSVLQLLNLKQTYFPQKLQFQSIDNEIFKRIRSQNIQKKTNWIKQQMGVSKSLDVRLAELENKKLEYKQMEIDEQKKQNQEIQKIRAEIIALDKSIQLQTTKTEQSISQHQRNPRQVPLIWKLKQNQQSSLKKDNNREMLTKEGRQRLLKYEMTKAEFESEKEYIKKRNYYNKAAEELFTYLIDC